ncbi:MAG: hypothetical protein ACREB3_06410 [Burkholderiales bacterium]
MCRAPKRLAQSRCALAWPLPDFLNSAQTLGFHGFFTFEKCPQPHQQRLGTRFCCPPCTIPQRTAVDWLHSAENKQDTNARFLLTGKLVLVKRFSFFDSFLSLPVGW